jgi:hypothetical protein
MLAYAIHLLRTVPDLRQVELYPDGEHGKRFEIARWLAARRFILKKPQGKTTYCGTYTREKQNIVVASTPGKGDVAATAQSGED